MILSLRSRVASVLLALSLPLLVAAQPMRYVYPPPESGTDVRMNYYWELLQATLDETAHKWGPYTLTPSSRQMNAARAEILLTNSSDITVMARTTSLAGEQVLNPIRIPLDKGLTGYRVFLIKADTQPRLDTVRTQAQLQTFSIGQGAMWVDADILRAQGFTVVTSPTYEQLLPMLDSDRFDLFSRGVNEVGPELNAGNKVYPGLAIENKMLLYYPLPRYYFFARNPEGEKLSQRVEEGLRLLMKSGKFERRYRAFKKSLLSDLNLAGRRVFTLTNPYLPPETPLTERGLWDTLEAELKARP